MNLYIEWIKEEFECLIASLLIRLENDQYEKWTLNEKKINEL
jgi:hypothetical protein